MEKIAVVVLSDTESPGDMGALVNALELAKEGLEHDDDVRIVFDGAGTKWIPALAEKGHPYHELYRSVREEITGACSYCSEAYGVKDDVRAEGIELLSEFDEHPSLRSYIAEGYDVITF